MLKIAMLYMKVFIFNFFIIAVAKEHAKTQYRETEVGYLWTSW